jgi:hypothetical protein
MRTSYLAITFLTLLSARSMAVAAEPATLMFFGTFHFENPGLDLVNASTTEIMSDKNQNYLQALAVKVAKGFKPTKVLAECAIAEQQKLDQQYKNYLDNKFELPGNETYQVGFRLAKAAGLAQVSCYDDKSVTWQAEALFQQLEKYPDRKAQFHQQISQINTQLTAIHNTGDLQKILKAYNSAGLDKQNKSFYLSMNDIGAGASFEGANSSASWWHRNFKMYANIQLHSQTGDRVFVIGGQGHVAIFRDMLEWDPKRLSADVNDLL